MLGIGTSLRSSRGLRSSVAFNPAVLFGLTDTGWVYDHSDFSTLFQDAAGTIPVTAVGQPVGLQLDKSGKGNHRTQSISLNRPTLARHPLGGIRNRLTFTEQFDNAAWTKAAGVTVSANTDIAPDGTMTADTVTSGGNEILQSATCAVSTVYTNSLYFKKTSGAAYQPSIYLLFTGGTTVIYSARLDTDAGVVTTLSAGGFTAPSAAAVSDAGSYWRLSVSGSSNNNTLATLRLYTNMNAGGGTGAGSQTVWGAQLELGATATAYQRVVTPFDVTEAGVPDLHYLSYDGINDSMATASFAWGTNKVTVVAGVRKLSDAVGARTIVETSANSDSTNGTFRLGTDAATFTWRSRGTVSADTSGAGAQPITAVLTGIGDIAGDVARLRRNAAQVGEVLTDQGTGNFLTYPAYFGARAGTSLFFNGREYSQFAINRLLTADELAQIEAYTAGKTGVVL